MTTLTWPLRRWYRWPEMRVRNRVFIWGERTFVVGVINATPDSFSGDGTGGDPDRAEALARHFEASGADIVDIGGESTRPDALALSEDEELGRVVPAVRAARAATALPLSVDTYRPAVARAALDAGADMVNDVHGLRVDREMARLIAEREVPCILMHNQRGREHYDVAGDIGTGWRESLAIAGRAGIEHSRVILDPGFGFGWEVAQNLEMLRRLPEMWGPALPILVGVSRKSTVGIVTERPVDDRLAGTAAAAALSIAAGADLVRVHDVGEMVRVVRMADAIVRGNWRPPG